MNCRVIGADALQHYEHVGCGMELPARGVLEVRCEGVGDFSSHVVPVGSRVTAYGYVLVWLLSGFPCSP
jgi:hypothetical protein